METIKINRRLYDQLRVHCDAIGIRFIDFVEDSLENACDLDAIEQIRQEAERLSEDVKKEYSKILLHGFNRGFAAAVCLLRGDVGLSRACTPAAAGPATRNFIPGDGRQMTLFD